MLQKIKSVLAKVMKLGVIDERAINEVVRDIQRVLIEADVNVKLVKELSEKIREKGLGKELPPGVSRREHLIKMIYDEVVEILGGEAHTPRMDRHKILLVGLYGGGKTTTAAKLALFYLKRGLKVCMVSTDVWRPAAFDQLIQLGEQIKVPVFGEKKKKALEILDSVMPLTKDFDIVIIDSAGRDSLNQELLNEIKAIKERAKPDETYLVLSADIGQTAASQAIKFNEVVELTGVIVTKADSSGKAGGALSACHAVNVPVTFIGTGEKTQDFEIFDAKKFVSRLLGYPDLEGLLKKIREVVEEEEFSPEDLLKGEYTLKTFYKQLEAMKKMGPLKRIFEMFGVGAIPEELVHVSEEKLKVYRYIMDSMTNEELENPSLIKGSRIKRIAKGSGRSEAEVRELLKQYNTSKKMIGKVKKGKLKGLLRQFKGLGIQAK